MTADQPAQNDDFSPDTNHKSDKNTASENDDIILQTNPTLRPTFVLMVTVVLIAGILTGITNTVAFEMIENQTVIEVITAIILILMVLTLVRLTIRIIILRQTSYIVRPSSLERETDLILRYTSRKAPVDELRGFEYSQNTFQRLLGYGSVRLLTGGTDQSLGFIVFRDLTHPDQTKAYIDNLISD
jgi:uncharacterized membrane protein YdbT with pleckstrin-like domain